MLFISQPYLEVTGRESPQAFHEREAGLYLMART